MTAVLLTVTDNPLLAPSALPFGAPPFDRFATNTSCPRSSWGCSSSSPKSTRSRHSQRSRPSRTRSRRSSAAVILLTRALRAFHAIAGTNTNDTLQDLQVEIAPRLAAHTRRDPSRRAALRAVHAIFEARRTPGALDPSSVALVERYSPRLRARRRAAQRRRQDDAARAQPGRVEARRRSSRPQLLAATKRRRDRRRRRRGSSTGLTEAGSSPRRRGGEGARARRQVACSRCRTRRSSRRSRRSRIARCAQRLFDASMHRADHGGSERHARDHRRASPQLRAERAKLLGFATRGDYTLDDQMAKTPATAIKLLTDIGRRRRRKAREPKRRGMQKLIDAQKGGFTLEPWDWQFYAEQVRKAEYDLDESQIKPYFELDHVLQDGVFFAAHQALRHHVQGAARHPGLSAGRARVRGVRRRRHVARALLRRLLQARQQERRRVDGQLRRPDRGCSAPSRSSSTSPTSRSRRPASRRCSRSTTSRRCSTSSATRCTACSRT